MNFNPPAGPTPWGQRLRTWGPYAFTILIVFILAPVISGISDAHDKLHVEVCQDSTVIAKFIQSDATLRAKEAERSRNIATFWSGLAFEVKDQRIARFINSDADTRQQAATDAEQAVQAWSKLTKGLACR